MKKTAQKSTSEVRFFSRSGLIKNSVLATVVVALHIIAVGGFFTIQGCGTVNKTPQAVEPAPAPVMPPRVTSNKKSSRKTRSVIRPPAAVAPAPAMVPPSELQTYTIRSGDSLSKVAQRFGVSARELADINGIKNPNKIRVGQKLVLPSYVTNRKNTTPKKVVKKSKSSRKPVAPGSVYIVKGGDVLSRIAVRHRVTVKDLRAANKLTSDKILVGQKLIIPGGHPATATPRKAKANKPVVKKPTAPRSAAPKPVVSRAKPTTKSVPKKTVVEEVVVIEEERTPPTSASGENPYYYTISEGDTLESTALIFSLTKQELMDANNMPEGSEVSAGDRLIIPF